LPLDEFPRSGAAAVLCGRGLQGDSPP